MKTLLAVALAAALAVPVVATAQGARSQILSVGATFNVAPSHEPITVYQVSCTNGGGCTATFTETGAVPGQIIILVNTSANNVIVSDTSGVTENAAGMTIGQWSSITHVYSNDRWVEIARSAN